MRVLNIKVNTDIRDLPSTKLLYSLSLSNQISDDITIESFIREIESLFSELKNIVKKLETYFDDFTVSFEILFDKDKINTNNKVITRGLDELVNGVQITNSVVFKGLNISKDTTLKVLFDSIYKVEKGNARYPTSILLDKNRVLLKKMKKRLLSEDSITVYNHDKYFIELSKIFEDYEGITGCRDDDWHDDIDFIWINKDLSLIVELIPKEESEEYYIIKTFNSVEFFKKLDDVISEHHDDLTELYSEDEEDKEAIENCSKIITDLQNEVIELENYMMN